MPGVHVITRIRDSHREFFVNAVCLEGEDVRGMFARVTSVLKDVGADVVSQEVFGLVDETAVGVLGEVFGEISWPVTWVGQSNGQTKRIAGTQIWAVKDVSIKPIEVEGAVIGTIFEDSDCCYCRLGDVRPSSSGTPRPQQAVSTLKKMQTGLDVAGMDFSHVIRTWFYNDDILSWYGEFNKARDGFFEENGVFGGLVPASTGVGSRNIFGAALVGGLLAIMPKVESVSAAEVISPLQSSALDYGSSFSRAVEFTLPGCRRLLVSGTASIDRSGKTIYLDNVKAQTAFTMKVVGAILESRGMGWANVTRGLAYFKYAKDCGVLDEYCREQGLADLPLVVMQSEVCRDDLLFEIELDALDDKPFD